MMNTKDDVEAIQSAEDTSATIEGGTDDFDEYYERSFGKQKKHKSTDEVSEKRDLLQLGIIRSEDLEPLTETIRIFEQILKGKDKDKKLQARLLEYYTKMNAGLINELIRADNIIFKHPGTIYYELFYKKLRKIEKYAIEIREDSVIIRDCKKLTAEPDWQIFAKYPGPKVFKSILDKPEKMEQLWRDGKFVMKQKDEKYAQMMHDEYKQRCSEAFIRFHTTNLATN